VEVSGCIAPCYDLLLNIATFGRYSVFIEKAISLMGIKPEDKILDLGAGTGRNAVLIRRFLGREGRYVGMDISPRMIIQLKKRIAGSSGAGIIRARLERVLPFKIKFDKVFISFVLHGFPQEIREDIIANARSVLKAGGRFIILDYNEFLIDEMPCYFRVPFKLIECSYAFDFVRRNLEMILKERGFNHFEKHLFFSGYVRLLQARKTG